MIEFCFLNFQCQIFHVYLGRKKLSEIKYTGFYKDKYVINCINTIVQARATNRLSMENFRKDWKSEWAFLKVVKIHHAKSFFSFTFSRGNNVVSSGSSGVTTFLWLISPNQTLVILGFFNVNSKSWINYTKYVRQNKTMILSVSICVDKFFEVNFLSNYFHKPC